MNMRLFAIGLTATVALAGCASTSPGYGGSGHGGGYNSAPASRYCADCGIVERIDMVASARSAPPATGVVLGGIVGAVAGRQISGRTGGSEGNKNVSTVAGAVAGAAAGKAIQNRTTGDTYNITVRMDDGRRVTISQHDLGGIRENTYVRIHNGRVVLR